MMFMSKRLIQLRKKNKLSLEKLAVAIGQKTGYSVTRQTLENWEKGRFKPSVEGLISICSFFDRPIGYFFDQKAH